MKSARERPRQAPRRTPLFGPLGADLHQARRLAKDGRARGDRADGNDDYKEKARHPP